MFDSSTERLGGSAGHWAFYRWRNVGINVWQKAADGPSAVEATELALTVRDQCPRGYSLVHLALPKSGVPDGAARSVFAQRLSDHIDRVFSVGILVEEQGFAASALRSAVTGILLLGPRHFPTYVKSTLEDLCDRLVDEHRRRQDPLDPAALFQALSVARHGDSRPG